MLLNAIVEFESEIIIHVCIIMLGKGRQEEGFVYSLRITYDKLCEYCGMGGNRRSISCSRPIICVMY